MVIAPKLRFPALLLVIFTSFILLSYFECGEAKKLKKRNKTDTFENAIVGNQLVSAEPETLIHNNATESTIGEINSKDADAMLNNLTELIMEVETEANSTIFNQSLPSLIWGEIKNAAESVIQMPVKYLKPIGDGIKRRFRKIHQKIKEHTSSFLDYIVNKSVFSDIYRKVKSFFSFNSPRPRYEHQKFAVKSVVSDSNADDDEKKVLIAGKSDPTTTRSEEDPNIV